MEYVRCLGINGQKDDYKKSTRVGAEQTYEKYYLI